MSSLQSQRQHFSVSASKISTTFGANTLKRFEVRTDVVSDESVVTAPLALVEAERAG